MIETIKKLSLGVILIAVAGGILLNSDRGSRRQAGKTDLERKGPKEKLRVALVQHASMPALDDGREGLIIALAQRGYSDGGKISIKHYNAESDIGTANAIAKEVTGGENDLIISISTPTLQTVANANRNGSRTKHVFGIVTDPYAAGIGIDPTNHALHPPYMTGYGSMQPVEAVFKMARTMRPELKTVGLVWNAAEANSLAQTKAARKVCSDLGITLLEANAENSSAALEALNSLLSRGVEAVWLSGDITVSLASESIINTCKKAGIPTFSSIPPKINKGSLFDLGANYPEIGMAVGNLAADVLDGKSPADIPVENLIPRVFYYNDTLLPSLKQKWVIPDDIRKSANGWITATETNLPAPPQAAAKLPAPQPGHQYKIGLSYFAPEAACESCIKGIIDGLRDLGFEEGKNLEVRRSHAQSEIANIPLLLQNFDSSDVDLILPMSTPVISAACGMVKKKPVVFTYCSDPVAAGAGRSFTDHLPNVTGIGSFPPVAEMVEFIHKVIPKATTVGTIYNASEANSVKVIEVARGLFEKTGMKLDEVTVSSSADVLQAAQALAGRHVDALYIQGDNTVLQGFEAVVKAARDARIPVFVDDPEVAKRGAVACVGLGYYKPGYAAAKPLARVLLGESPAKIPMENVAEKVLWLNLPEAEKIGITFPKEILDQAFPPSSAGATNASAAPSTPNKPFAKKVTIDLVEFLETPNAEENLRGINDGLDRAGLKQGAGRELRVRNAQGDIATLNGIVDAAVAAGSDLIITASTPALQSTLQRAKGLPVVFSLVANPLLAGAGKTDEDHLPFVTGAYIPAPNQEALEALRLCLPKARNIGTLFVPSEVNSVFYKEQLEAKAKAMGFNLKSIGVSSSSEVADAALALCSARMDAIVQISDNVTAASFSSIAMAAQRARLPLLGFASGQAENGAFMTVSRDYHEGGMVSADLALRVLRGESPRNIPFQPIEKTKYTFNQAAAARSGITIPQELLRQGTVVK